MNLKKPIRLLDERELESVVDYIRQSGWKVTKEVSKDKQHITYMTDCPLWDEATPLAESHVEGSRVVHYLFVRIPKRIVLHDPGEKASD